ncbi:MAG: class I SAM-dependent methyltransferase [Bacteroidales bacterium]|nr:class I SAM-dependent methyltransferase [Bacteroidales bacterium]
MQKRHTDRERYFEESSRTSCKYYMPYIENFHRIKSGCKILEVGCGEGGNLLPFAQRGCEVVGIEQQKEIFYLQHNKK